MIGAAAFAVAAGALHVAVGRRAARGRWLLAVGTLAALFGMMAATLRWGEDAYGSTVTAAAGVLTFAAFWSVALAPSTPRAQVGYGILSAGALLGYLLVPRHPTVVTALHDVSYGLSGWSYVAGAGVLVAGLAFSATPSAPAGAFLSLAMLCLTVSLAAQGAATQWAWGSYWAGDPAEYLRLIGWISVALGWVIATEFARHPRAAVWSLRVAAGIVVLVLLGSLAIIEALGLPTLYLAG